MHLPRAVLRNVCLENFLQINTEASVVEFIFRKTPCFQHILMNNFRQMRLKYENFSLRGTSDISDIQTTFKLKKFYCKNCQCKYIKNENDKCYLDNKKQKTMLLVLSWSDAHRKIGGAEVHLSRSWMPICQARYSIYNFLWIYLFRTFSSNGHSSFFIIKHSLVIIIKIA